MYGAAEAAVQSISEIVSDPEAAAELQGDRDSALKKKTEENDEYLENLFMLFFSIVFIADACMYVAFARKVASYAATGMPAVWYGARHCSPCSSWASCRPAWD